MINESEMKTKKEKKKKEKWNLCVSQTCLALKWRNKNKCGLRRAHLCILSKNVLREREKRKAKVFRGEEGLLCKSFHLFKILQEGRRKKARASSAKGFKV